MYVCLYTLSILKLTTPFPAVMAAAWHGGLTVDARSYVGSDALRSAVSLAMGYWFDNDFTDAACLDSGGKSACPCGTPGFWSTNWYSNVISPHSR